jgi:hypothetical protein
LSGGCLAHGTVREYLKERETAMKSKSKPGPAGEKSRRAFMQKIGTAAAASSLAASVSSAQQKKAVVGEPGAGFRNERDFVPQPGPEAQQPMPTINLGKLAACASASTALGHIILTHSPGRIASGTRPNR